MRGCPKKCPHNHHNDHPVGELACAGLMTLSLGLTRCSRWIGTSTPTWALSARSHLSLPLSKRDIILIGPFANHLLAGTTHLEDKNCLHKMDV
jgi:hypothetical protein